MKKVYFKKLLTFALAICLTFTSAFVFSPQASIQVHAVGNINNPTPLQPNSNIDFSSGWTNIPHKDHHCYKVVLPADGLFSATLMQQNSFGMSVVIRKAQTLDSSSYIDHNRVYADYEDSPVTKTVSAVLSAGTYYITVENDGGRIEYGSTKTPSYKLKTTYESFGVSETRDSYDSPKNLSLGVTYTDAITKTDGEDWYKVVIPEDKKYVLKCSVFQNPVTFKLKNADLKEVYSIYCTGLGEALNMYLTPGIYYLHVNGSTSKYTFSLDYAKINPSTVTKVKAARHKKVDVTFKQTTDANGYQIRYSTDKNFNKNVKTKTFEVSRTRYANGNKRIYTISKLKKNKKYYFQVRAYVIYNNVKYYSDWSKAKKVKVK